MSTSALNPSAQSDRSSPNQSVPSQNNLNQLARDRSRRSVRVALVIASLPVLIQAGVEFFTAETQFDASIAKEIEKYGKGVSVNQVKLRNARDSYVRIAKVISMAIGVVGVILLLLCLLARWYPMFSTTSGFILFVGFNLVLSYFIMNGQDLISKVTGNWKSILWEVLITLCLVKGIFSAIALRRI